MKELIIIIGTTLLGCVIFGMMVGQNDGTLQMALGEMIKASMGL